MNILDKLLYNLKTISCIPKGKRISTAKEFIVIEDESMIQGYYRWKNSDSRDKATNRICNEIRTVLIIATYIMESRTLYLPKDNTDSTKEKRIEELKKIRISLLGVCQGINNLSMTYEEDANVVGNLVPLVGEIDDCIHELTQVLIDLGVFTEIIDTRTYRRELSG